MSIRLCQLLSELKMFELYLCEHLDTIKNIRNVDLCQATNWEILYIQAAARLRLFPGIDLS